MSTVIEHAGERYLGQRDTQEDDLAFAEIPLSAGKYIEDNLLCYVVCDGMGGYEGGEVASSSAVAAFIDNLKKQLADQDKKPLSVALRSSVLTADKAIAKAKQDNEKLKDMGCTLVSACVENGNKLRWVSVGDSHLYVFRDNKIKKLNQDHSYGAILDEQVRQGSLSAEEAQAATNRNALTSALQGEDIEKIDNPADSFSLQSGDIIVLASDGLDTLSRDEIIHTLSDKAAGSAQEIVASLIEAVHKKGAKRQDNTTVACIKVPGMPAKPQQNFYIRYLRLIWPVLFIFVMLCFLLLMN